MVAIVCIQCSLCVCVCVFMVCSDCDVCLCSRCAPTVMCVCVRARVCGV